MGIQPRNIIFNLILWNILNKVKKGGELCIILPYSQVPLFAGQQCPFCIFFGKFVAKDCDQPAKKSFHQLKLRDAKRHTIKVGVLVVDTLLMRVVENQ
jgi:hypothetical protein